MKVNMVKIISVGGGAGNIIDRFLEINESLVECIAMDTHLCPLTKRSSEKILQLGKHVCGGLATGANPMIGIDAAVDSIDEINSLIEGAKAVIIVASMGGGTGAGVAPVVAREARKKGIRTIGIASMPFEFEGAKRKLRAEMGVELLKAQVDMLMVYHNSEAYKTDSMLETFAISNDIQANMVVDILKRLEAYIMPRINNDGEFETFSETGRAEILQTIVSDYSKFDRAIYKNEFFFYPDRCHETGSSIHFGGYKSSDSGWYYSLSWLVLKKEKDRMLLVSQRLLNYMKNIEIGTDEQKNGEVRDWLNRCFINETFSNYQQSLILNNEEFGEKIFIISKAELNRHLRDLGNIDSLNNVEAEYGVRPAMWVGL